MLVHPLVDVLGDPEIQDLGLCDETVRCRVHEKDVVRFQIAVNHARGVRGRNAAKRRHQAGREQVPGGCGPRRSQDSNDSPRKSSMTRNAEPEWKPAS